MNYDDWKTRTPESEEDHLPGCPARVHSDMPCACAEIQDDLDAMAAETGFDAEREGA